MAKKVVVIDPGHGGKDRYNRGPTKYVEADGNLIIAKLIKDKLMTKYGLSIVVNLTRATDQTVSLTDRGMLGANSDLFLSIHSNASENSTVRGSEVFHSVDIPEDARYARKLSKAIAQAFGVDDRGAKTRESLVTPGEDYYTVIDTAQDHGAKHVLLVESLFHSNGQDEEALLSAQGQNIIADETVKVVADVLQLTEDQNNAQASEWATEAQAWVKSAGISDGTSPKVEAAREEVWVMLKRLHDLLT